MSQVHFMFGEDAFSLLQEVSRWKKGFLLKHGDLNLEELSADEVTLPQLKAALDSLPFLGEKRLVILKRFLETQKKEAQEAILKILPSIPESSLLLWVEFGKPDARTSLFKTLKKTAKCQEFNAPKGPELLAWIEQRAKHHGLAFNRNLAQVTVSRVGTELWALDIEIHKLSCRFGKTLPTPEQIRELLSNNSQESIFTLTDQLAQGNTRAVLATLKTMENQGSDAMMLFAMIARQLRLLLEMKDHSEKGLAESVIAKIMDVHPFVVQKTLPHAKRFSSQKLKKALENFKDLDRRLKQGHLHLRPGEEFHLLLKMEECLTKI
jgi:DNA polymerase-3 subunit delta